MVRTLREARTYEGPEFARSHHPCRARIGGHGLRRKRHQAKVARVGQGRSGGYRILIAFHSKARAVFLYGFAKNERENIDNDELATLREIAAAWLTADTAQIERAIAEGTLQEVES